VGCFGGFTKTLLFTLLTQVTVSEHDESLKPTDLALIIRRLFLEKDPQIGIILSVFCGYDAGNKNCDVVNSRNEIKCFSRVM